MKTFLHILSWVFGIIFFIGSVPYFCCGEFFLGLWSLVVVIILIPPLYNKLLSERMSLSFTRTRTVLFSLVIFAFLFANFIEPLFDKEITEDFYRLDSEIVSPCLRAIESYEKNKMPDKQCNKYRELVKSCSLSYEKEKNLTNNKKLPNVYKLTISPLRNYILLPLLKKQLEETKEIIKQQCGDS